MKARRSYSYHKHWNQLIRAYGNTCYYCNHETASVIDHIVPVSAGGSDYFDNLVPSCALCNLIAADKVFDGLDEKRTYVIKERNKKSRRRRCLCTQCCMPYEYRFHSPSSLLCAECYAIEYGTAHNKSEKWLRWLNLLHLAGQPVEAYARVREEYLIQPLMIEARYRILWNAIEETLDVEKVILA